MPGRTPSRRAAINAASVSIFVQDPGARRHPLHVAWANYPATAGGVTMFYLSGVQLSPFLLLDYAGPYTFPAGSNKRGVGEHPHRGFETV
jgi:redox-sensitive bicupin YhaK (pirin superfamily)